MNGGAQRQDDSSPRQRIDPGVTVMHVGDVVAGRYRVQSLLGRGGFGVVYAAEQLATGQSIALKMLLRKPQQTRPEDVARFRREAQLTARLCHPNTVRVLDVGETLDGDLYIAMERLYGPTLAARLRQLEQRGQAMTAVEAGRIAAAVLGSLDEAHRKGLVHRDLKPANIVLSHIVYEEEEAGDDEDGATAGGDGVARRSLAGAQHHDITVKVLDFGIASVDDSNLTGSDTSLGTPSYMSPEQCEGRPLDGRSDVYSLGVILFRCVTGQLPFRHANPLTLMYQHAHAPIPDLLALAATPLPLGFVACVRRALMKDPARRFSSAAQMRRALEAVQGLLRVPAALAVGATQLESDWMIHDDNTAAAVDSVDVADQGGEVTQQALMARPWSLVPGDAREMESSHPGHPAPAARAHLRAGERQRVDVDAVDVHDPTSAHRTAPVVAPSPRQRRSSRQAASGVQRWLAFGLVVAAAGALISWIATAGDIDRGTPGSHTSAESTAPPHVTPRPPRQRPAAGGVTQARAASTIDAARPSEPAQEVPASDTRPPKTDRSARPTPSVRDQRRPSPALGQARARAARRRRAPARRAAGQSSRRRAPPAALGSDALRPAPTHNPVKEAKEVAGTRRRPAPADAPRPADPLFPQYVITD